MPIFVPGIRDRHNRPKRNNKRSPVAMLTLTAMVDMFTVLAVFLLQNYQTTGEVVELSDDVVLPKATAVKELKPAHVVLISPVGVSLDKALVIPTAEVRAAKDWEIQPLITAVTNRFKEVEDSQKLLGLEKLRDAVNQTKPQDQRPDPGDLRRVTVQADKSIDFLTIKKVMYTLYQAGASEINFAVMKNDKPKQ